MNKLLALCVGAMILFTKTYSQDTGINFEHHTDWQGVLAKAKRENKFIYVDCYTTWCVPCRKMSNAVFPLKEVGDFFNENFINVRLQFDSTASDVDDIKILYPTAALIKKQFLIRGYPTNLFFNPDGLLVNKILDAPLTAEKFIALGKEALDPEKQFYTQVRRYDAGERSAVFLKHLILLAIYNSDYSNIAEYTKSYYSTQPDLLGSENLFLVYKTTTSAKDTGFRLILDNTSKFETVVDKIKLHNSITHWIIDDEFYNRFVGDFKNWNPTQWDSCLVKLKDKYPSFALDAVLLQRLLVYQRKKEWNNYADAADAFIANKSCTPEAFDNFASTIYYNTMDKKLLTRAASWSRKSFIGHPDMDYWYVENYAAILHKMGADKKAMQWALKAQKISMDEGVDKSWGQELIDRIKKGRDGD